ncbi:MAG: peptidoglycan-binding domain-containing protein [bacterium]
MKISLRTLLVLSGAFVSAALIALSYTAAGAEDDLFPPNAKAGECYARVYVPPTYKTETTQVLKREASDRVSVTPERYEMVDEQVLVKAASQRLEIVPAEYAIEEETVLVKPAAKQLVEVPAVYETTTEQVLEEAAHTTWKKGRSPVTRINGHTGEIMCLVEVPARYKTISKRVLKTPATTREIEIPAEYKTVSRRVMKTPPTTRVIEIPAEYKTIHVKKLVAPAEVHRTEIPAEYQTVTNTAQVTEGYMEWQPVLCETNMSNSLIYQIQRALQDAGHSPGSIDGVLGSQTMTAVHSFQVANSLPTGGLTLDTLAKLGVTVGG